MDSMPSGASQQSKTWMIVSVVLLIALIAVIAFFATKPGALSTGASNASVVKADDAAKSLVDFINKVYAQQVGSATLKSVVEENGLYKVTVGITANGAPVEQEVYLTRDGKLFVPQVIKIDDVMAQYEDFQRQQQAGTAVPGDATATPDVNINTDVNANTNTELTPAQ